METKQLLKLAKEKGYITLYLTNYGYVVSLDNQNLKAKIIDSLEDDEDLVMLQWTKYEINIFSCKEFNDFCENSLVGNKLKVTIPIEIYENSFLKQYDKAFEKFNDLDYNYKVSGGCIINLKKQLEKENRQKEIDEFVKSI